MPWLRSLSHITGGGIIENTHRVLERNQDIKIDWDSWEWLPIFKLIQQCGKIRTKDMLRPFNLGIGMVLIIDKNNMSDLEIHLKKQNEKFVIMGEVFDK